jgi:hypothetical protein
MKEEDGEISDNTADNTQVFIVVFVNMFYGSGNKYCRFLVVL